MARKTPKKDANIGIKSCSGDGKEFSVPRSLTSSYQSLISIAYKAFRRDPSDYDITVHCEQDGCGREVIDFLWDQGTYDISGGVVCVHFTLIGSTSGVGSPATATVKSEPTVDNNKKALKRSNSAVGNDQNKRSCMEQESQNGSPPFHVFDGSSKKTNENDNSRRNNGNTGTARTIIGELKETHYGYDKSHAVAAHVQSNNALYCTLLPYTLEEEPLPFHEDLSVPFSRNTKMSNIRLLPELQGMKKDELRKEVQHRLANGIRIHDTSVPTAAAPETIRTKAIETSVPLPTITAPETPRAKPFQTPVPLPAPKMLKTSTAKITINTPVPLPSAKGPESSPPAAQDIAESDREQAYSEMQGEAFGREAKKPCKRCKKRNLKCRMYKKGPKHNGLKACAECYLDHRACIFALKNEDEEKA